MYDMRTVISPESVGLSVHKMDVRLEDQAAEAAIFVDQATHNSSRFTSRSTALVKLETLVA